MKNNIKYGILIALVFLGGLLLGRLLFMSAAEQTADRMDGHAAHEAEDATIWTCSMHPQIKQPEPGQCPLCGMDLIPLETSSAQDPTTLTMTTEAVRLANIQTTTIGAAGVNETSEDSWLINGKILPDERKIYAQTPHIDGRIESLSVTYEGMYVSEGSTIAQIYSPEVVAAQRELLEAQKLQHVNVNLLESARRKLRYLKISEKFIENLETTGEVVETFPLVAGKSGYVLNKKVETGDHVLSGQVLFDIYDLSSVWAVFDVYEKDMGKISEGDAIEFTSPGVPDHVFKSRIDFINPLLDPETRAIRIRGQVNNRNRSLKPQMLIRGRLIKSGKGSEKDILVPKTAVLWTGRESVVYVQDTTMDIPTFAFREITLGTESGAYYSVMHGLVAGEKVVTNGVFAVDASAQLNNQRSMMNRLVTEEGKTSPDDLWKEIEPVDPALVTEGAWSELEGVLEAYMDLKDDLITGEEDPVRRSLDRLKSVTGQLENREDLGPYNEAWNSHIKNLKKHLQMMLDDQDVVEWRRGFAPLSTAMIHWIIEFGNPQEEEVYVQHCPMAEDDQGADWLSYDHDIKNPYYGAQMLTCGITEDTLLYHHKNH